VRGAAGEGCENALGRWHLPCIAPKQEVYVRPIAWFVLVGCVGCLGPAPVEESPGEPLGPGDPDDPEERLPWDPGAPCTCGADVTAQLDDLAVAVLSAYQTANADLQAGVCNSLDTVTGWDIIDFYHPRMQDTGMQGSCGADGTYCDGTVTAGGNCYAAEEVNYFLYGLAVQVCGKETGWAEGKILAWRGLNGGGAEGRIAWFRAGHDAAANGSWSAPTPALSPDGVTIVAACPEEHADMILWKLGSEEPWWSLHRNSAGRLVGVVPGTAAP